MAKENSVITMVGTAAQDNSASIDIPDDGFLLRAILFLEGVLNADTERVISSLEFGSVSSYNSNDGRSLLGFCQVKMGLLTSGASINTASQIHDYGDPGIKVFGGERIYLHTAVTGGTLSVARALLIFNFSTFVARRR